MSASVVSSTQPPGPRTRVRGLGLFSALVPAVFAVGCDCGRPPPAAIAVRFSAEAGVVEWVGLPDDALAAMKSWPAERFTETFPVTVAAAPGRDLPAVAGTYTVSGRVVRFAPRFAFAPGMAYRAVYHPAEGGPENDVLLDFRIPAPPVGPTVRVEQVFPTSDRLPENQLKFYIHFTGPMARGEAYGCIHLIDETAAKQVDLPFLELDQELWDPTMTRFTLFFDPGRIKRGLKPRQEHGPALEEGKTYTLVIDRAWSDAQGRPLAAPFRKTFRVGPPDDTCPELKNWKLTAPAAGSRAPLTVDFGEPMDHAMMLRVITVRTADGREVTCGAAAERNETRLLLTPAAPWSAGSYRLAVDNALEDLAGNSLRKPFEVDIFRPIQARTENTIVTVEFEVK